MRVHERTQKVTLLQTELKAELLRVIGHDQYLELTYIELLQALNELTQSTLRYALRVERHPEDPNHPADEA